MGQTTQQLEDQLAQATSPKMQILRSAELAWHLREIDRPRVQELCNELVQFSREGTFATKPFMHGLAVGLIIQGYLDFRALAYTESLSKGQQAVELLETLREPAWLPRAYNIVSMGYGNLGNHQKCLYFLDKQYKLSTEIQDFENQAAALHNTGTLYLSMEAYDLSESRKKFEQSVVAFQQAGKAVGVANACSNIASVELLDGNPEKAIAYCEMALPICIDKDLSSLHAMVLARLGQARAALGMYDEAFLSYSEGLDIAEASGSIKPIFYIQLELGKLYFKLDSYDISSQHLDKALAVARRSDNFMSQAKVYEVYRELYVAQGKFEQGLTVMKAYFQAKEQEYAEHSRQQAQQFEMLNRLELEVKNAEIFQLKNQKLEQMVEERTQALAEKTADLQHTNLALEEASKRKDAFLATVSHELRTPLNVIMTSAQALKLGVYGSVNEAQQAVLEGLLDGSGHLLSLIDDVLDVSKISSGNEEIMLVPTAIIPIVQSTVDAIQPIATTKNLTVIVDVPKASPIVKCDVRRIKQIVTNLLSNAVKFTPDGGLIEVAVVTEETQAIICVADSGIGISKSDQALLFEPFVQADSRLSRNYEGTGLGLALVKQLTELHNGTVKLESKLGQGSKFFVYLPLDDSIRSI